VTDNARPALRLVTTTVAPSEPAVRFCGNCAQAPPESEIESRICTRCHMGVVLEAAAELAPKRGEAFMVVDAHLAVSVLSPAATKLLGISEDDALNRPLADLIAPADVAGNALSSIAATLMDDSLPMRELVVRPAGVYGVRFRARVGPVGTPRATLLVFERFGLRR
jgi:PAS domain-containing protein